MHARWPTVNLALQVALAAARPAAVESQPSHATIEVGAARLRQRDVPLTGAVTAAAAFRHDAARYAIAAGGAVTLADEGRSTSQGVLAASILRRPGGRTRWEFGAALTAFAQGSLPATAGGYLLAREHFAIGRVGGWAGLGFGGVEESERWSPTRTAEVGSWVGSGSTRLTAAAVLVDTRSEPYDAEGQLVTDPVTYTDLSIGARWALPRRVELDARGGVRLISRGALTATGRGTRPFAAVDAAVWLTPRVGLALAIGRQLSDLARGTPDTHFASLALRVSLRSPAVPARRPRLAPIIDRPRLALLSDTTGQIRLVVTAPQGALVELAANFTGWEPVALVRRGDGWEFDRPLPSGAHRLLVRVDGGAWVVPANLPAAADDFGGAVGILTVP